MFHYFSCKTWQQINDYIFRIGLSITFLLYLFTEREKLSVSTPSEKGVKTQSTKAKGLLHCVQHKE